MRVRKKMEMLKAEQEKLAAEQGKLAAEGDRLATELFIKFEMHADRGAIQRLDVVNGTPQGFVLGRFKAIVQDPLARSLFPSLVIDPIFRADECTVRSAQGHPDHVLRQAAGPTLAFAGRPVGEAAT